MTQTGLLCTQKAENTIEINTDGSVSGYERQGFSCSILQNYLPWATDSSLRALKFGVSNAGVHPAVTILIYKNKQSNYKCFFKTIDRFFFTFINSSTSLRSWKKKKKPHYKKLNIYVCTYATTDRHIHWHTHTHTFIEGLSWIKFWLTWG